MAKLRSEYWILSLQQLVKKTIKNSHKCKRFFVSHYPESSTRLVPVEYSTQHLTFKIISLTTQALNMESKGDKETKVYLLLFTWRLTRAYIYTSYQVSLHRSLSWFLILNE